MLKSKKGLLSLAILAAYPALMHAAGQRVGSYELDVDAPYRIEPQSTEGGRGNYGKIPIHISFRDGNYMEEIDRGQLSCSSFKNLLTFGLESLPNPDGTDGNGTTDTCNDHLPLYIGKPADQGGTIIEIWEMRSVNDIFPDDPEKVVTSLNEFHEIERTIHSWKKNTSAYNGVLVGSPGGPIVGAGTSTVQQVLCQPVKGESCNDQATLSDTSTWDATLLYQPKGTYYPGDLIDLKYKIYYRSQDTNSDGVLVNEKTGMLTVRVGDPLPTFGNNWGYGDIHYHSQGTDNDGESGYNYRGTLLAMQAMGLDFLFATDHASNSSQINNAIIQFEPGGELLGSIDLDFDQDILRDMSPARWKNHWHLLNGTSNDPIIGRAGANQVAERSLSSYPHASTGRNRVPQIFLGSEVDVIPEVLAYNGLRANHESLGVVPATRTAPNVVCDFFTTDEAIVWAPGTYDTLQDNVIKCPTIQQGVFFEQVIPDQAQWDRIILDKITVPGRALIRDSQLGLKDEIGNFFYGRQHLVHLANHGDNNGVFSNTSKMGGATKRLSQVLNEGDDKGYFFLAHPVARTTKGRSPSKIGPDILPYSEIQLSEAMANRSVLGLQAWNENDWESVKETDTYPGGKAAEGFAIHPKVDPYADLPGFLKKKIESRYVNTKRERSHGLFLWDWMLMKGISPAFTNTISWLRAFEPRKLFFAAGSDAHGDFNFHRNGYFVGLQSSGSSAMGNPRNHVQDIFPVENNTGEMCYPEFGCDPTANSVMKPTHEKVINSLKSGKFIATDGPIVRMAFDLNGNGNIDDSDAEMGESVSFSTYGNKPLIVEWRSTPEFGEIEKIKLFVGSMHDSYKTGMLYGDPDMAAEGGQPALGQSATIKPAPGRTASAKLKELFGTGLNEKVFKYYEPFGATPVVFTTSGGTSCGEGLRFCGKKVINFNPSHFPVLKFKWNKEPICNEAGECFPGVNVMGLDEKYSPKALFVRAEVYSKAGRTSENEVLVQRAHTGISNPIWLSVGNRASVANPVENVPNRP